jgi:hypothetical protein
MNPKHLQAYVNLIQQLLTCPRGEEWILLRQNEALVTPDLVQVMEQVATQLTHQGNTKEAKFLHNLAGQIHHLFVAQTVPPPQEDDRAQAYVELIKALLDCPEGAENELLAVHQDLIGPGLVRMMQQVAAQLAVNGDPEAAQYLQQWSTELGRRWLQQHDLQPSPKPDLEIQQTDYPSTVTAGQTPQAQGVFPISAAPPRLSSLDQESSDDPWAESIERGIQPEPLPTVAAAPLATPSPPPLTAPAAPAYEPFAHYLETIATALTELTATLQSRPQPDANPLWYMEVLEQAQVGGWVLTSEEVQRLIGVKPSCPKGQDSFQRGCWVFVRMGKLGAQTAWQVKKTNA